MPRLCLTSRNETLFLKQFAFSFLYLGKINENITKMPKNYTDLTKKNPDNLYIYNYLSQLSLSLYVALNAMVLLMQFFNGPVPNLFFY